MKYYIVGFLIIVAVIIVIVAAVFGARSFTGNGGGTGAPAAGQAPGAITSAAVNADAYGLAKAKAQAWEPDAALFQMVTADASGNDWNFIFVSPAHAGEGFEVTVDGSAVVAANQISVAGSGAAPPANAISPDDAITEAHAVPGYASATIVALTMIYNRNAARWYWSVKAANGAVITVKATP
jgi:hypothetical protein